MNVHLTSEEIDNLVSGLASAKDVKKAQEHLLSCAQCSKAVETLSFIVAARPQDAVPGEHVKSAIMAEWHRLHNESAEREAKGKARVKGIMAGFAAAAASVVIALSAYMFLNRPAVQENYPLSVASFKGEVYVNNSPSVEHVSVVAGSDVKTGTGSSAVLNSGTYNLYMGASSIVAVTGNSTGSGISFSLVRGTVISKSSGFMNYGFTCGDYTVQPAGTVFLLEFSGKKLDIAVAEGKISVTGPGVNLQIPAGNKWSSLKPGTLEVLDEKDALLIKSGKTLPGTAGITPESGAGEKEMIKGSNPPDKGYTGTQVMKETVTADEKTAGDKKDKAELLKEKHELRRDIGDIKKEIRKGRRAGNRD